MAKRSKQSGPQNRSNSARTRESSAELIPANRDSRDENSGISGTLSHFSWLHIGALVLVVLSMTPLTHNLDDIKVSELLMLGSVLSAWGVWLVISGRLPVPSRAVGWGLGTYWSVMILSTSLSRYGWAGWHEVLFTWACIGFFFGGMAAGSNWSLLRRFCDAAIVLVLAVNLFGFFQYDLFGTGRTGMSTVYGSVYGNYVPPGGPSAMQSLFYTFASEARTRLMSTALNRDFYAAFCLLYFPLAASYTLITRNRIRIAVGSATALFTLISVFLCKSKGEYLFAAGSAVLYLGLFALAVKRIEVNVRYVWAWLAGVAVVFLVFFWMNLPTLMGQLKDVRFSFSSREIIFAGAWGIFKDFPILGGGPGTFKIYFPVHRRPDYFDHEISNVTELAHNYILNILSETGLAGGLAFGVFAIALAALAFRAAFRAQDNRLRLILIAVLCGLFGMYGSNMTSTSGYWPIGAVGLWTFMGLLMGMVRQSEGWQPSSNWPDWARPLQDIVRGGWSSARGMALRRPATGAALLVVLAAGFCLLLGPLRARQYWTSARAYNQGLLQFERVTQRYYDEANNPNLEASRKADLAEVLHDSESNFLRTLEILPSHVSTYYKLGSVYNLLANMESDKQEEYLEKANKAYETLYQYAPDYAEIHYNFGVVNYRLGRLLERRIAAAKAAGRSDEITALEARRDEHNKLSERFFERMKEMSDKPEVTLNLGDTYMQGGQFDKAQAILADGMERYPSDERFVRGFYAASTKLKDPVGQIKGLKGMWTLAPGSRQFLYSALQLAIEQNNAELFSEVADAALQENPVDPIVHESIARWAIKVKEPARLAEYADAYARLLGNPDMLKLLNESGGVKGEIVLAGAEAADGLGDSVRARRLYGFLASQSLPEAEKARQWLQMHPG